VRFHRQTNVGIPAMAIFFSKHESVDFHEELGYQRVYTGLFYHNHLLGRNLDLE
jgi:hypothetical protein